MSPDYQEGDFVFLATRPLFARRLRKGNVIVFENALYGTLIKRIQKITNEGIYVVGAHKNSLDSRRLGTIAPQAVQGKVIGHIRAH